MGQRQLSKFGLEGILQRVSIGPAIFGYSRSWSVLCKGDGFLLQLCWYDRNVETGNHELQKGRKWYISPYSTDTEVVETAFKAARTAIDHELKENFRFDGAQVYCPHFDVLARKELAEDGRFDTREAPE